MEQKAIHGGDIYRNRIKIDFSVNTNPFGVLERVRKALMDAVEDAGRYPDIQAEALMEALSGWLSVPKENLACGNGASELFAAIFNALRPKRVLLPVPSFYGYEKAAKAAGSSLIYYEMSRENGFAMDAGIFHALTEEIDLVFLANPGNPVGNVIGLEMLLRIARRCLEKKILLVIDECFIAFTGEPEKYSFLGELDAFGNVIIVQAFTKLFAIPGVRLGYLICRDAELVKKVKEQLPEWNLSVFAQKAGVAVCGESEYVKKSVDFVCAEREWLGQELAKMGVRVYPSKANYLLMETECPLYEKLLERGILIRDCSNFKGLAKGYYRIAVKSRGENEKLLASVREILQAGERKEGEEGAGCDAGLQFPKKRVGNENRTLWADFQSQIEYVLPEEIEKHSFEIISEELRGKNITLRPEEEMVIKRVIHTSADFSYAQTMTFSPNAVEVAKKLIVGGADIVTDTNMALSGINKKALARYGGTVHCFMADEATAELAKERKTTRAAVSMERAAQIDKPVIFAVGNAPTALIQLYSMIESGRYQPAFIIGVPVGFVNVEAAKELILKTEVPYIINRGRKGGSNVAAAICNAILYELAR